MWYLDPVGDCPKLREFSTQLKDVALNTGCKSGANYRGGYAHGDVELLSEASYV